MTHLIVIRFHEGLTSKHQLTFKGRTIDILSAADMDEHKEWHMLIGKEVR